LETLETTGWSADRVTHRETQTPKASLAPTKAGDAVAGVGQGQISQIIQNVLVQLLGGGGILGGGPGGPRGPAPGGPQETHTQFITHTRTLLTTMTQTDTVLVPVNYRGSEIYQTVTEQNVVTKTTTDFSVQTLLSYAPASEPFYPLAPTLHRAVRIVPNENPVANLANLYNFNKPPQILSTSFVTETLTQVTTVSTDLTTPITVTLGARELLTEIIEPTTMVLTTTSLSTKTILLENTKNSQLPTSNAAQIQSYAKRLQLVKTLLSLKQH